MPEDTDATEPTESRTPEPQHAADGPSDAEVDDALRGLAAAVEADPQLAEDARMVLDHVHGTAHDPTGAPE